MAARDEFLRRVENLERLAKAQVYPGSAKKTPGWAGTEPEGQSMEDDQVDENGTDYQAVKKALADKIRMKKALTDAEIAILDGKNPMQAIARKVAKGMPLTPAENWAIKGGRSFFSKAEDDEKPWEKEKDEDEKKEDEAKALDDEPAEKDEKEEDEKEKDEAEKAVKSFTGAVRASPNLSDGFEASQFLAEMVRAIGSGFDGVEVRTAHRLSKAVEKMDRIEKSLGKLRELQGETAKTVADYGLFFADASDRQQAQTARPVGPPRAVQRSGSAQPGAPLEKSGSQLEGMSKSMVASAMADMVQKGVSPLIDRDLVLAFDMNATRLTPEQQGAVASYLATAKR